MQTINFNEGKYKEFAVNGDESRIIKINTGDYGIIERLRKAMHRIEDFQSELEGSDKKGIDIFAEMDSKAREIINEAFNSDVCTAAFGETNCFSEDERHRPIIINFLEAFLPVLQNEIKSTVQAQAIHIEKKTDKYIKPVLQKPQFAGMAEKPAIDISSLTQEQKDAILRELFK